MAEPETCELSIDAVKSLQEKIKTEDGQRQIAKWFARKVEHNAFTEIEIRDGRPMLVIEIFNDTVEYFLNQYEIEKLLTDVLVKETHRGRGSETERI